jgi:hypothetical protein
MHAIDLFICFGAGILSVLWFEATKFIARQLKIDLMKI